MNQKTLNREVCFEGIGLHTGRVVRLCIKPAGRNEGVLFKRVDIEGAPVTRACLETMSHSTRGTNLRISTDEQVHTIEHLMAALYAAGIDNALIELDGPEPPALDGSAFPYLCAVKEAGTRELDAPRKVYELRTPFKLEEGNAVIIAHPAPRLRVSYTLEYANRHIGCQFFDFEFSEENFELHIAKARTFCLEEEVNLLRKMNLAQGGSLENAVVFSEEGPLNPSLRYPDEPVRHKILDFIGDMYAAGLDINAHFICLKSGHQMNRRLFSRLKGRDLIVEKSRETSEQWDVRRIEEILPHRFPFLLVDRIVEMEVGKRAVGIKNVTINEPFFQGHFPGQPVMPGVLITEAMAQVAGVCILSLPEHRGRTPFFTGLDNVKFRRPIVPGDQIRLEIEVDRIKGTMGRVRGRAIVDGKVAAEGILKFTVM